MTSRGGGGGGGGGGLRCRAARGGTVVGRLTVAKDPSLQVAEHGSGCDEHRPLHHAPFQPTFS